ncbi:UNVERIFIED_ORG: endonuclease YncB(thermonuclease family) [Rhizobium esperanzae]
MGAIKQLIARRGDKLSTDRICGCLGKVFVSGIDTPEMGSHAKCIKERKLALIAKGRLKELLAEKGLRIEWSGAVDKTQTHRPLVNIYRTNGEEIGKKLLRKALL